MALGIIALRINSNQLKILFFCKPDKYFLTTHPDFPQFLTLTRKNIMKTNRKISEPIILLEVWNQIEVERIDYSALTEDERRLLEVVKKVGAEYFGEK